MGMRGAVGGWRAGDGRVGSTGVGEVQDGVGNATMHDWAALGVTIGLQLGAGQLNCTAHNW